MLDGVFDFILIYAQRLMSCIQLYCINNRLDGQHWIMLKMMKYVLFSPCTQVIKQENNYFIATVVVIKNIYAFP